MSDYSKIIAKIADLKAKIEKDSISPLYLGCILEEMLLKVRDLALIVKLLEDNAQSVFDKARLSAELTGFPPFINPKQFKITGQVHTFLSNVEISDQILDSDVSWSRYSEDKYGNQRTASDQAWTTLRGNSGKTLTLTPDDLDATYGLPPVCIFTATVDKDIDGIIINAKASAKIQ